MSVRDTFSRPLRTLRVSVTDRCNLRCEYCMPEDDYVWLPRGDVLHFEEIEALVGVFESAGVGKVRLTGGEPLMRRGLERLVAMLAARPGITDLSLTTNGLLLADRAEALKEAGLHRINVSLDTLRRERFKAITRTDALDRVLAGIDLAARLLPGIKLDAVVERGVNDDELDDLIEYGRRIGAEVRFIEYMDVAGATRWRLDNVVSRREILALIERRYGAPVPFGERSSAPADRFVLPDGTCFGVISSTTEPFCRECDRSRLTADGIWYLCLYGSEGTDLRALLRSGISSGDLLRIIEARWQGRSDRGAEERLELRERKPAVPLNVLRQNPHLEMHKRGG
jgi:GTP 3',8-cyclase